MTYEFCRSCEFERYACRIPPSVGDADLAEIFIDVPEDTTMYISSISATTDVSCMLWAGGMRLNVQGLCPDNTMPAFELAHRVRPARFNCLSVLN